MQADKGPEHRSGQTAQDDQPRQGSEQATFPVIAPYAARRGDDVEQLVGGTGRGGGAPQYGYLKGQEQKGPGHAAQTGQQRNRKGRQRRQKRRGVNARDGEKHGRKP